MDATVTLEDLRRRFALVDGVVKERDSYRKAYEARYTTVVSEEHAGRTGSKTTVIVAELPPEMIPKCIAGPGMLAHVLALKFAYHVPFNRQEKMHSCEGFPIDRATMCRWAATREHPPWSRRCAKTRSKMPS